MNKQKIASITKGFVGITSSIGTGFIVGNIVMMTTPPATRAIAKFCINMAAAGISGMVANRVVATTDETIDQLFNTNVVVLHETVVVTAEETPKADSNEKDSE